MIQGPDFRHFVAFVTVAEELSFSKAAARLNMTQPTLSEQIKQLEEWHGDPLAKKLEIPKAVLSDRLRIMFHRNYHPLFHDQIMKKFKAAGIKLKPTETIATLSSGTRKMSATWASSR